jgi:hypothetical protein
MILIITNESCVMLDIFADRYMIGFLQFQMFCYRERESFHVLPNISVGGLDT